MSSTKSTTAVALASRGSVDPWGRNRTAIAEHSALVEKLNEEARENWGNDLWHKEVAQDIANTLDYGFTFDNLFQTYFRVQNVGEWDRVVLRERRGLQVFFTSRGGYIDETQIRTEEWTLPRDTLGFHVSEHEDKLRANFGQTMTDLVSLGQARMEAEVNRRILTLLQQAIPSSSPYYVATAGLTKVEVDANLRAVRDAIKPNGLGPVPVTILGRASMVDQFSDFNLGFDPEATEEIRAKGRLGVYRAANIINIINYTDEDGVSYIPANELWIFGGDVGQFALYGGLQVKTWDENTVDYRHYRARKDVGGLIHHPEQARRIVDSTVTP
jgi:hypothetical protein